MNYSSISSKVGNICDFRENRHKIAKNRQNSLWLTNSGPTECSIFKTVRLFENGPNLGHKTPK